MKTDSDLSDFIITTPYTLSDKDNGDIYKASHGKPRKEDWDNKCLDSFKEHIRTYYRKLQHCKCAYCRMDISMATSYFTIEHIVPKSMYPEWMYNPKNICLSCAVCNSSKNDKNVLRGGNYVTLPTETSEYIIVHPHKDRYSEHIEIIDGLLYKGLTGKGARTIEICNLTRVGLLSERAKNIIKNEHGGAFAKLMNVCSCNPFLISNMDELIESIKELIDNNLTENLK